MQTRSAAGAASTSRPCYVTAWPHVSAPKLAHVSPVCARPTFSAIDVRILETPRQSRRGQVALQARGSSGEPWWEKDVSPNTRSINSVQELVNALAEYQDKLIIVDFYAQWCGSCRALYPKLTQLVSQNVDSVVLLKVDFEANKLMCKNLGVKVLPYFHLYRGAEGRVDSFSASVSKLQRLKDALEVHGVPFCSLAPPPELEEFPEVHPHVSSSMGSLEDVTEHYVMASDAQLQAQLAALQQQDAVAATVPAEERRPHDDGGAGPPGGATVESTAAASVAATVFVAADGAPVSATAVLTTAAVATAAAVSGPVHLVEPQLQLV